MDRGPYAPMLPSSEAPNPLRPYYRPPSIGGTTTTTTTTTANPNTTASLPHGTTSTSSSTSANPTIGSSARTLFSDLNYNEFLGEAAPTTGASVRSLFDQLVWKYSSVFLAQPFEVAKTVLQVRLADEVVGGARQSGVLGAGDGMRYGQRGGGRDYGEGQDEDDEDDDDDDDEPSYFTSSAPQQNSPSTASPRRQSRRRQQQQQHHNHHQRYHPHSPPQTPSTSSTSSKRPHQQRPQPPPYRITLRHPDSLLEVISQLWSKEGSWGIWKGTNVTFLYSLLLKTAESWTRSMLSAVLNLPDPGGVGGAGGLGGAFGGAAVGPSVGGLDIIDSPAPWMSLGVAVLAAGFAGLVMAPLDVVRTRIILTPTTSPPRTILSTLRTLPSYVIPAPLLSPTLVHSTIPAIFTNAIPLFLRNTLHIDPILTPSSYSIATFAASVAELFVKLPVETVLRRAQMQSVLGNERRRRIEAINASSSRTQAGGTSRHGGRAAAGSFDDKYNYEDEDDDDDDDDANGLYNAPTTSTSPSNPQVPLPTTVEIGPYTGVIATMWRIAREEGTSASTSSSSTSTSASFSSTSKPTSTHKTASTPKITKGQGIQGLWRGWRVGAWGLVGVWGLALLDGGTGNGAGGAGGLGKGGEF